MDDNSTASWTLHGRILDLTSVAYGAIAPAPRRYLITVRTSKKLTRIASNALKMVAKAIRQMQVPVYCPAESGVQAMEKRDVLVETKNVMDISSIPIIVVAVIELAVAELVMVIVLISISSRSLVEVLLKRLNI